MEDKEWKNLGEVNFLVNYKLLSVDKGIHTKVPAIKEISLEQVLLVSAIKADVLASYANEGNVVRESNPYNPRFLFRSLCQLNCPRHGVECILVIFCHHECSKWGLLWKLLRRKESHFVN